MRKVAELNEEIHQFRKGTLKLGYSLKKCGRILQAEAIKKDDDGLRKQAEAFERLFSGYWCDFITISVIGDQRNYGIATHCTIHFLNLF